MSVRFFKTIYITVVLAGVLVTPAWALDVPTRAKGYVNDYAGVLSAVDVNHLNRRLQQFELLTSNQVVVAIFKSLEGESLEDFSIRLAEKWKVGQRGKDNGVILSIFIQDRQMRIEVGYGLEGALPDALAGQIIANEISPAFKQGKMSEGITLGVNAIMQAIQGEYQASAQSNYYSSTREMTPEEMQAAKESAERLIQMIFFFMFFIFCVDVFRFVVYRGQHQSYSKRYQFIEWFIRFAFFLMIISFIFRMMLYAALFSGRGRSSGGGGFSGGGGSFGGGGASGRW